ncbi:MAG: hypothetical protein ACLQK4_05240 [Acidimicrobiales bacterium]|jgi:hypothetical protein
MPRRTLRSAVTVLSVGAICTVLWTDSAPSPQSVVLVGYGSSQESAPGAANAPGAASRRATPTFSIAGKMSGLFPGKKLPLVLRLHNPNKLTITVTSVTTSVENATSKCGAKYVSVTGFSGHIAVAAGKTEKVTLHVTMKTSAPNSCEGKSFPFHYKGSATEA